MKKIGNIFAIIFLISFVGIFIFGLIKFGKDWRENDLYQFDARLTTEKGSDWVNFEKVEGMDCIKITKTWSVWKGGLPQLLCGKNYILDTSNHSYLDKK